MRVGPLEVTFHRTDRVQNNQEHHALPPGRGIFEVFRVADYTEVVPASWERNGVFVAIHPSEALWLSFHSSKPVAVQMGAGGVNAITGEKLSTALEEGSYMVCPPQPWIDGWKTPDGTVRQFVATFHEGGKGKTVAEQIIGDESATGALGIAVFESKEPLKSQIWSSEMGIGSIGPWKSKSLGGLESLSWAQSSFAPEASLCTQKGMIRCRSLSKGAPVSREMGLGAGGKIEQHIYPDPHGLKVWQKDPVAMLAIYFVDAEAFGQAIGKVFPKPLASADTGHPGFTLKDGHLGDTPGNDLFDLVETVEPTEAAGADPIYTALNTGAFPG